MLPKTKTWCLFSTNHIRLRYKPDYLKGLSVGYTGFDYGDKEKNSLSVGYEYRQSVSEKFTISYMIDGYYSDKTGNSNFDYENYLEFKWKLNDNVSLVNLFDYNNFKGVEFYKFRLGIEYQIEEKIEI